MSKNRNKCEWGFLPDFALFPCPSQFGRTDEIRMWELGFDHEERLEVHINHVQASCKESPES